MHKSKKAMINKLNRQGRGVADNQANMTVENLLLNIMLIIGNDSECWKLNSSSGK
jgi:hypothetical protein